MRHHCPDSSFMMMRMLGGYPGGTGYGLAYHHNGGLPLDQLGRADQVHRREGHPDGPDLRRRQWSSRGSL